MNIIAGVTDLASKVGSFNTAVDHAVRIAVPKAFTARDLAKFRRDCEIFLERLQANPKDFQDFLKEASAGNFSAAQNIAKRIRITEEDFEREGGGWVVVVLIIVFLLIAHEAK